MASAQSDVDWQLSKRNVLERNRHMFNNSDMSDISFICKGLDRTFYAHKYVLGTSSPVFYEMFYGVLAEQGPIIELDDTDNRSFEEFLRFLYTDECRLTAENVGSILYLAKKYMVQCLTELCIEVLEREMKAEDVLSTLEKAIYFDEKELEATCWHFIEWNASDIVSSESFNNISQKTLRNILSLEELDIPDVEMFQAVLRWSEVQCIEKKLTPNFENRRSVIGDAIHVIKFLGMNEEDFAERFMKSGLFSSEELVQMSASFIKGALCKRESTSNTLKVTYQEVEFRRFNSATQDTWQYDSWKPDRLCFSVSKDALFHGTCLFGNSKRSEYDVTLEVKGVKVSGKYSHKRQVGLFGFNVMFKSPIVIKANEVVTITARIKGPPSFMGTRGLTTVERHGVTVTLMDAAPPNHGTSVAQGQFYSIILSIL